MRAVAIATAVVVVTGSWVPACAGVGAITLAQAAPVARPSARDLALKRLAQRLDLPLVEEAFATFSAQLRRTLPGVFVDSVGQGAVLGPRWRRGNRYFDEALRRVDAGLADEEARGGPLVALDRSELLDALRLPWSEADVAFVLDVQRTPLGREAVRALDAKAATETTKALVARIRAQPGFAAQARETKAAFADLDARAMSQSADASLMLLAFSGSDPARARRLQALVEQADPAASDAVARRLTDRLSQRLLAAAAGQLPDLLALVVAFQGDARP